MPFKSLAGTLLALGGKAKKQANWGLKEKGEMQIWQSHLKLFQLNELKM